ncbi:MAG: T9SS type A sorting domain-containing protein [Bacteroidetes bacterium]|nr:T9SS type A sorting domain-containing protein [Bacteroidota bacterium]
MLKKKVTLATLLFAIHIFCYCQNPYSIKNPFCVQMHIHGISNHNGNDLPGSMQFHNYYASQTNTDVVWWSEHMHSYHQYKTATFSFANAVFKSSTFQITGLSSNNGQTPNRWEFNNFIGTGTYNIAGSGTKLTMGINSDLSGNKCYLEGFPRSKDGLLTGTNLWVRPLSSYPLFSFKVKVSGLTSTINTKVQFIIPLNYHNYNGNNQQQQVIFNFIPAGLPSATYTNDSMTVIVNRPISNGVLTSITVDFSVLAPYLKDGFDNVISDYRPRVEAKSGMAVSAEFSDMAISATRKSSIFQWDAIQTFGNKYDSEYPVKNYFGSEFSFTYLNNSKTHFNGFVADSVSNQKFMHDSTLYKSSTVNAFTSKVKDAGGITCYNHPFGTARLTVRQNSWQDTYTDQTANYILSVNAFDCDLMEVGYEARGQCDLAHHISLWDKLTANGLFLYANAVGDRHGGNWFDNENPLNTWVWSETNASEDLIRNMKEGRLYFGNSIKWDGNFYFNIDSAYMGDRFVGLNPITAPLNVVMTTPLQGSTFRYTHGLIQSGINVTYLAKDVVFNPNNPPMIDRSQESFVRVTVTDNTGKIYVCSNPIVFGSSSSRSWTTLMNEKNLQLAVLPNGESHHKTLKITTEKDVDATIDVFDLQGKIIEHNPNVRLTEGLNTHDMHLHNCSDGLYIVRVTDGKKLMLTQKFAISSFDTENSCQH